MYRKNVSGQYIGFQMVLAATGAKGTGLTVAVRRCLDGTFGDGGGTVTEDGTTGGYKYAMSQGDTNANNVSLYFSATGAIPIEKSFVTTAADPTDGVRLGLTALPNAAADAAGGLPISDAGGLDMDAIKSDSAAIKTQTDKMAFTVTNQIDANVLDWKSAVAPAMTGDAYARIGAAGAGLTALGDTRIANLDATVSSRSTYAGGAVASVTGSVGSVVGLTASDVGAIKAKTDNLPTDPADASDVAAGINAVGLLIGVGGASLTAIGDARLANLDAAITTRLAATDYVAGAVPGDAMTLESGERDAIATALLTLADGVETGVTVQGALRVGLAADSGKLSGAATNNIKVRDKADTKDRIDATVDASGNRTAVTLDLS